MILRLLFSETMRSILLKSSAANDESNVCVNAATEARMLSITSLVMSLLNNVTWHLSKGVSCVSFVVLFILYEGRNEMAELSAMDTLRIGSFPKPQLPE